MIFNANQGSLHYYSSPVGVEIRQGELDSARDNPLFNKIKFQNSGKFKIWDTENLTNTNV